MQVPLDQHIYNSFVIKDGEASKSFQELVAIYLLPAMQVIARSVDRAVLGQVHKFLAGPAGRVKRLLNLNETNSKDYLLEARKVLNDNKALVTGRNLALHRDALALVTRPLALPSQSIGVMAAVAAYNDVAMRVTMQYNSIKQGTVVNMDILAGVAVLDPNLAVVLQG